jgi:hypothetical protein
MYSDPITAVRIVPAKIRTLGGREIRSRTATRMCLGIRETSASRRPAPPGGPRGLCPECRQWDGQSLVRADVGVSGQAVGVALGGVGSAFEEAADTLALWFGQL